MRNWRCDSGAEFVEAALAFPLLLLLVLGIMDFGLLFQQYEVITNAAREGARVAVLPGYQANLTANVQTRVTDYINASFLGTGGSPTTTVTTPAPVNIGGNCMAIVRVQVTYNHTFIFVGGISNYFGGTLGTKTLRAASTMRKEVAGGACP